jgi:hypothetical protein
LKYVPCSDRSYSLIAEAQYELYCCIIRSFCSSMNATSFIPSCINMPTQSPRPHVFLVGQGGRPASRARHSVRGPFGKATPDLQPELARSPPRARARVSLQRVSRVPPRRSRHQPAQA